MAKKRGRYSLPFGEQEGDILPNKLNLTTLEEVTEAEFEGFLRAQIILVNELTQKTVFDAAYIRRIHQLAFKDLYFFAGKYRTVNISKGGFLFPVARFLDRAMAILEAEMLQILPSVYEEEDDLIQDIARIHAELLYIHPFREGNGRVARLLADMMALKQGYDWLNFSKIDEEVFPQYVRAVQAAVDRDYQPMEEIIRLVFY